MKCSGRGHCIFFKAYARENFHCNHGRKNANGNLKKDRNKDIGTSGSSGIAYNHLNLPTQITVQGKGTIDFVYDARGNKLKKIVTDTTTNPDKVTTTLYMAGVYENDSLQYLGHEEGRIRYNSSAKIFNWDYFIKDHLGNVRIVLTEEQKTTAYPAATMEDALASTEQALYANLPETRSSLPGGYPLDNSYSDPNLKAAKVNGNGQKIGPSITLKVMAGDKFNVKVSSWYRTVSGVPQTTSSPLTQLINAISTSVAPISAG